MNKHIINSKIILFLGAGASAFLEKPLMVDFVDGLLTTLDVNLAAIAKAIIDEKGNDMEVLLNELDGIIQRKYFIGDKKRNYFKDSFDAHDSATSLYSLYGPSTKKELPATSRFGKLYKELCDDCSSLKWQIYDRIFEKYYNIDELKVKNLYMPFLTLIEKYLTPSKSVIPIFTTNYDKAIEKYCATQEKVFLIDGFQYNQKTKIERWGINNFDNFKPKKNNLNLCLFKMHGSIFWYRVEKEIIYSPISTQNPSDGRIEPVIIFPTDDKDYNINFDPFITSYCYLQRCLDNAKVIIFIGYSFRDYITITFLKSALRFNSQSKIIIIDPNATTLRDKYFEFYQKRFTCINKPFTNNIDEYSEQIDSVLSTLKKQ